ISLEHEILLHPRYFGPNLLNTVKQKLFTEVEGTCTGKGLGVTEVTIRGGPEGLQGPTPLSFPFLTLFPHFSPLSPFLALSPPPQVGLFTEIGPMSCFISRHVRPQNHPWGPQTPP
ncbi:RPB7 polymerase, partial [Paradoxornis webbianus]|nr:RPB7 polymerase [Sinosuthora webbiana]